MDVEAAKLIGAGLAAISISRSRSRNWKYICTIYCNDVRNPAAKNEVFGIAILGFALTEAVALYALVMAFLIMFS